MTAANPLDAAAEALLAYAPTDVTLATADPVVRAAIRLHALEIISVYLQACGGKVQWGWRWPKANGGFYTRTAKDELDARETATDWPERARVVKRWLPAPGPWEDAD